MKDVVRMRVGNFYALRATPGYTDKNEKKFQSRTPASGLSLPAKPRHPLKSPSKIKRFKCLPFLNLYSTLRTL